MIQYQVFKKDWQKGEEVLIGVLTERRDFRKNLPDLWSALKWAKTLFGGITEDPHSIFIRMTLSGLNDGGQNETKKWTHASAKN